MLSKIPRGRFVLVDEIAAMVAWLVSQENSFTTGAVFDLSGGRATYLRGKPLVTNGPTEVGPYASWAHGTLLLPGCTRS